MKSFNLDCKLSSIMILYFNFPSASSEGSDEPVHLQSLARAFPVRINKIWYQMKTQIKYWSIPSYLLTKALTSHVLTKAISRQKTAKALIRLQIYALAFSKLSIQQVLYTSKYY